MGKRLTQEEFIHRCKETHPEYIYVEIRYDEDIINVLDDELGS